MTGIIRKRASVLFCSALLLASSGRSYFRLEVMAFGLTTTSRIAVKPIVRRRQTFLYMHIDINRSNCSNPHCHRHPNECRRNSARKAALVDDHSSNTSEGIRSRVQSFLRSKKTSKNKVVQEVTDIDAIKHLLGESKRAAAYTAVIFHAPYCKACKASMPLFERLAKKYSSKAGKKNGMKKNSSWIASKPSLEREESQQTPTTTAASMEFDQQEPSVRFLSVPVTQENAEELQDRFGVTKFPLAHIYDPMEGLVDERPVLRKLFAGFEERLASVVVSSSNNNYSNATMI
mmetsp:Transcript_6004/g.17082  ORF Transcript_6004/g.17082 Transcript_6004/m.17082 type:complete len:289 (+) Transcript_6004:146-1012(+)